MTDHRSTHDRREEGAGNGPFRTPEIRERPWESTELERGPFDRRSARNRRAGAVAEVEAAEASHFDESSGSAGNGGEGTERRRRSGRRKADVLRSDARSELSHSGRTLLNRLQKPIIGLTLAGVAAPLVNAGVNPDTEAKTKAKAAVAEDDSATAVAERDLESAVGDEWAAAEEASVRESTIEGAVTRYDIERDLAQAIYDNAQKYDIEPDVAYGLVFTESTFRLRAVSHVGARGLTQLMPRTAKWLDPGVSTNDLYNPDVNLDLGFRYLRQLVDKYDGDMEKALTAYNRGPGTVDKILKRGGNPDNGYAGKVLRG